MRRQQASAIVGVFLASLVLLDGVSAAAGGMVPQRIQPGNPGGGPRGAVPRAATAPDSVPDGDVFEAIRRGEPNDLLVVFDKGDSSSGDSSASEAKRRVIGPGGVATKAGVKVLQDYSMLPIAHVLVSSGAQLDALQGADGVVSVAPNRQVYPMRPAGNGGSGGGGGGMSMGGMRPLGVPVAPAGPGRAAGVHTAGFGMGPAAMGKPAQQEQQQAQQHKGN